MSDNEPDQGSDMSACIMRCSYNYRVSEAQRLADGANWDHHHAESCWVARRQYMTREMSGGGWRDSSRVTRLLAYRTLRKRDVPLAAAHTRVARTEPG